MSSKTRSLAINLLKRGHSYNEIESKLKIPKSTLSNWFSQLPKKQKTKIRSFRIKNWQKSIKKYSRKKRRETLTKEKRIQEKSAKRVGNLSKKELFLVGTSLYWAEGSKTNRWQLQFSNSDPKMIKLIMEFFRKNCSVKENKFYLQMILHENVKEEKALNYWSRITKIPKNQFKKACYSLSKSSQKKRNKNRLPFGTLQVRILDKNLTHQVYGYIKGLRQAAVVQW